MTLEIWRLHKNPDGSTTTVRFETPGSAVATAGGALSFRTSEKEFRFRDWAMAPAETTWSFTVAPDGRGVLTAGESSYFAAAKKRGQDVPPPAAPVLPGPAVRRPRVRQRFTRRPSRKLMEQGQN